MLHDPLPTSLAEAHTVIRELRGDAESLQEAGAIVGIRLGVTAQAGALLVILARANGRPLSPAQIEFRLPKINPDFIRGVKIVHVIVHTIRRRLGEDAVLSNGRGVSSAGAQSDWMLKAQKAGAYVAVCKSLDDVQDTLSAWLQPLGYSLRGRVAA